MKQSLVLSLVLISSMQSLGFSVLTNNNLTQLDVSGVDSENVDVFRQLLNQETLIRMALVKNVHSLMKDMVDLKQTIKTLETTQQKIDLKVTNLQQEVDSLKRENLKLDLENRKYEDTLSTIKQNFTQIHEHFEKFLLQVEEEREAFERNTSTVLIDLKVEVRYLSITLFDLNKHTLEVDKGISEMIEEKYEVLSNGLNNTLETFNKDLITTNNKISGLDNLQKTRITSVFDEVNKTIVDLKAEVKESQFDQMKLSSTVSALEVFRMNMTTNKRDVIEKVAFTASVTSSSFSWNSGTLVFPAVITNVGNGYNPSNGMFTAPTNGNYVFFVNVHSYSSNDIYVDIVLNGSTKVRTMSYNGGGSEYYESGPNLAVLTLQKGDRVWVKHYSGKGYSASGPVTTFSGFLI